MERERGCRDSLGPGVWDELMLSPSRRTSQKTISLKEKGKRWELGKRENLKFELRN